MNEATDAQILNDLIPHEGVSRIVDGASPIRAWPACLRSTGNCRQANREKIAAAFGIKASQLEL